VIKRANDTEYGLVAYLYTKDMNRGMRWSSRLRHDQVSIAVWLRLPRPLAVLKHRASAAKGRMKG
jgi:acyl-CoA reductase-like NAD-dependent aldehyde dehydrogenase